MRRRSSQRASGRFCSRGIGALLLWVKTRRNDRCHGFAGAWLYALVMGMWLAAPGDAQADTVLSTRADAVALVVPGDGWEASLEQHRPDGTATHYVLSHESRALVLSVYIDQTDQCDSAASCLSAASANPAYAQARGKVRGIEGRFEFISFHLIEPLGYPVKQAHILASAYLNGHWLDVHISSTAQDRPPLGPLLSLLASLEIR